VVASSLGIAALSAGTATEAIGATASIAGTCTGARQGVIQSDTSVAGHKGYWALSHISDGIVTPFDQASGLPSGRHAEQGVKITMAANPATIGLVNAQLTSENLTSCTFTFYRPMANGAVQAYFQIKLTNANVVSYGLSGSPTGGTATTFSFTAQHIARTWLVTNKTSSDDWESVA
jgi:type VI secretion system Hcp family effector